MLWDLEVIPGVIAGGGCSISVIDRGRRRQGAAPCGTLLPSLAPASTASACRPHQGNTGQADPAPNRCCCLG